MVWLIMFSLRVARGYAALSLVWIAATALAGAGLLVATGRLVGAVPRVVRHGWDAGFTAALLATVALFLLGQLLPALWHHTRLHTGQLVRAEVADRVTADMLAPVGLGHLEDPAVQDEYARAAAPTGYSLRDGVDAAQAMLAGRLAALASAVLVAVAFSWWIAALALLALWLLERYFARQVDEVNSAWLDESEQHREADYHFALGMGPAAKELRVFGLGGWLTDRYTARWDAATAPARAARARGSAKGLAVSAVLLLGFGAAIWYAAARAADGALSIAATTTVVGALMRLAMGANASSVSIAARAAARLRALETLPERIAAHARTSDPGPGPAPGDRDGDSTAAEAAEAARLDTLPVREIRFERVCFRYPGADRDVLHDLDLTIRAGEALALVGVNGAGKSTLTKLLTGGHRPTSGRITADGTDLAALAPADLARWQRRIAAITQDFLQLPLPAAENVALGPPDEAALADAAARAGAADLVDRLPDRWRTVLDKSQPGGADLSGGEWQRIALARALYAVGQGAGVLVLDEPAAALDVRAEAALVERYLELTSHVTSLIISHRFSVVRDADRICVLADGRITESGTHGELLAADGRYAAMFRAQADRYAAPGGGPRDRA